MTTKCLQIGIILVTLFLPQQCLTFSPIILLTNQQQLPLTQQAMSRRYQHGGGGSSGSLYMAAGQQNHPNPNGGWNKALGPPALSTSMDDLTILSSARTDLQDVPFTPLTSITTPLDVESPINKASLLLQQRSSILSYLDQPSLRLGRCLVILAAGIYGTNFSIVKILDDAMPLSVSATLRFGLAAAVVSAIVLSKESDDVEPLVRKERNLAFWGGVEIGLWYSIGYIAQAEGLQTVAAGKSAFFCALAVVVVPVLDVLFKNKILKKTEVASILIACLGVGLLELGPEGGLTISPGDVLAFMQTIFFGVGYWRLETESQTHNQHAARLTVGQLAAVAFGSLIYAITEFGFGHAAASSTDQLMDWFGDPVVISSLIWTGLVSTALALYLETVALKVVSATELTLLMTTTSLWGAGFAFITLGEVLTPTGFIGGLLILGGCVLGNVIPAEVPDKTVLMELLEEASSPSSMVLPLVNSTGSFLRDQSISKPPQP